MALTLLLQAPACLNDPNPSTINWIVACASIAGGGLLLLGWLTPLACIIAGLASAGAYFVPPNCSVTLSESSSFLILAADMLIATAILGPGAFSIDARMFGRREIIIPTSSTKSR